LRSTANSRRWRRWWSAPTLVFFLLAAIGYDPQRGLLRRAAPAA